MTRIVIKVRRPVIFLDIDGVLNKMGSAAESIDPDLVKLLAYIFARFRRRNGQPDINLSASAWEIYSFACVHVHVCVHVILFNGDPQTLKNTKPQTLNH